MDAIANKIGYARVSILDQDLELKVAALKAAAATSYGPRSGAERRLQDAGSFALCWISSVRVIRLS